MMENIVLGFICKNIGIGVVSGIVASAVYAFIKTLFKPRIDIWDFVCLITGADNRERVVVKIVNKSRTRIVGVECRLQYYSKLPNGGYHYSELDSVFPTQPVIEKYINDNDERNSASLYAVQEGYFLDRSIHKMAEGDKFVFYFKGTHPLSGTTVYKTVEFLCGDEQAILKNKRFKSGTNKGCEDV